MTVSGLVLLEDFVSVEIAADLLKAIDALPWRADLKRRVQHYGYLYDYRRRNLNADLQLGPLPRWLVLRGEARYHWRHSIPARKTDVIDGVRVARTRRVSVTFRCVIET